MNVNMQVTRVKKGVALIIAVGVLALVAMIATSFAINMQMEYRGSANFLNSEAAACIAEAGLENAIADIRNIVAANGYSSALAAISANYPSTAVEVPIGNGTYEVEVKREDNYVSGGTEYQKININTMDETDYIWIDALKASDASITYGDIAKIIDYRDLDSAPLTKLLTSGGIVNAAGSETGSKNAPYATVEELRLVLNNDTKYNAVKDKVTVYTPIKAGGLIGRYYSNVPGFDSSTILDMAYYRGKVIELGRVDQSWVVGSGPPTHYTFPGADGGDSPWQGWPEVHDAEWAGCYIAQDLRPSGGGWGLDKFGVIFTGYIYIPENKVNQDIEFVVTSKNGAKLYIAGNLLPLASPNDLITSYWSVDTLNHTETGYARFGKAGWHPMKIEYFNRSDENVLYIEWNALGAKAYIPAEYFGWAPASYYGDIYDDNAQLYIMQKTPAEAPSTSGVDYNSAGIFTITSTGRMKGPDGSVLAEKIISETVELFGTWTQTTRAEFYASWMSDHYYAVTAGAGGAGFSDGEVFNVNWMDSCPTDEDYWEGTNMHWEGIYQKTKDSLKLGYWDNFDEDVSYTVIMLRGGKKYSNNGPLTYQTKTYDGIDYTVPAAYSDGTVQWATSFGEFQWNEGAPDPVSGVDSWCLEIRNTPAPASSVPCPPPSEDKTSELNGNYYYPTLRAGSGYDMFARVYVEDKGQQYDPSYTTPSPGFDYPATYRQTNIGVPGSQYVNTPPWMCGWLVMKQRSYPPYQDDPYWYIILKAGDPAGGQNLWGGDVSEVNARPGANNQIAGTYPKDTGTNKENPYILAGVGVGTKIQGYYSYLTTPAYSGNFVRGATVNTARTTDVGVVKFEGHNSYIVNVNDMTVAPKIAVRKGDWWGCDSQQIVVFDNARVIYPSGYFVSAPFVSTVPGDNSSVTWARISWSSQEETGSTAVTISARAGSSLSVNDQDWVACSNNASLSGINGRKIQYKALLTTNALSNSASNTSDYSSSSKTPVLKDLTVTYMKTRVPVLCRQ